ncbi:MAG: M64 family metallopeptidase [Verrucomicrobiota bacterium]
MKSLLYLFFSVLCLAPVALHAQASVSNLVAVEENGPRSKQLNFVYLSDGFTSGEMGTFASEVQRAVNYLFTREPWSRYRKFCNIYRIEVPSAESGTSDPDNNVTKNTYFQSYFWRGIDRLNVLSGVGESRAYSIMNSFVPEYDVPVVIVNTTRYGGSGGPIAVATRHNSGPGLVEHETGHSFAGLGDEYQTPTPGYTQFEWPNTTQQADIALVRWKIWVEPGTPSKTPENNPLWENKVGHFEGANYSDVGQFRAHDSSIMQFLSVPNIGQVNREAFVLGMYKKVALLNDFSPAALTLAFNGPAEVTLNVSPKEVLTAPFITVEWQRNGVTIPGETGTSLSKNTKIFGNGTHKIKAIVRDPTDWIKKPTTSLAKEVVWTLNLSNQVPAPVITNNLPASRALFVGNGSVTLDATATGDGTITYQWLKNNAPLKPAVTTPTLTISAASLADAGTYSVKVMNSGPVTTQSCIIAVLDPNVPRVVVGEGKTATLAFTASANLPFVVWMRNSTGILNGGRIAGASTKALQIKQVDSNDTGTYFFTSGGLPFSPVSLLVVTGKTDYTGVNLVGALPPGMVGAYYNAPFPMPLDELKTPNSFAGTLPGGLKMDAKTGRIMGTPTVPSKNQIEGDEITFTVGNEFGKVPVKIKLLIKSQPGGAGVYSGLVMQNSTLGGTTGGRIDFTVMSTGSYSGTAVIGPDTLRFTGVFSVNDANASNATSTLLLKPKHTPAGVQVLFSIYGDGDADPLTATISSQQNFFAWRNKWLAPENLDTFKGYYTFAFDQLEGPAATVPKGHGFGSVTIDANGKTVATGKLPDGESFTTTSHLSSGGTFIIYQTLYTTAIKGSFIALMDLDPGEGTPVFGDDSSASWLRPAGTGRVYKSGFGPLDLTVMAGGVYTAPVKPQILMELGAANGTPPRNARLVFASQVGDDPLPVEVSATLEIKSPATVKVNPNTKSVAFSVTAADGRFKGSYTTKDDDPRPPVPPSVKPRPQITRKADYQGIIVRDQGALRGVGFFLRDALPKADGSTTPTTSPRHSGFTALEDAVFQ